MQWTADAYRLAATERIGEANALRRGERYALAMYLSGLAAECMLRAYRRTDRPFDERHDLTRLFQACDLDHLGDAARRRLRGPLQTIHLLWSNRLRFAHEKMVRDHLHGLGLDRDVYKGANALKVRCVELFDACADVVSVGEERWTLH